MREKEMSDDYGDESSKNAMGCELIFTDWRNAVIRCAADVRRVGSSTGTATGRLLGVDSEDGRRRGEDGEGRYNSMFIGRGHCETMSLKTDVSLHGIPLQLWMMSPATTPCSSAMDPGMTLTTSRYPSRLFFSNAMPTDPFFASNNTYEVIM